MRQAMRSHTQWLKLMGAPTSANGLDKTDRPHVPLGVMRPVAVYR